MKSAGYSSTPLAKKLGIKPGYHIRLINAPDNYFDLFSDFPAGTVQTGDDKTKQDFIHYFTANARTLEHDIIEMKTHIVPAGAICVSWPKKASKVPTDVTENLIRDTALRNGLVDIKVCAVDEVWSGLKLVIPLRDR